MKTNPSTGSGQRPSATPFDKLRAPLRTGVLYYGDNLDILRNRDYFPDASVDLVYLDPPFNSKADYNLLFREASGERSQAQIRAFSDFWHWPDAVETYNYVVTQGPPHVSDMLQALYKFIGPSDMMAYLVMMAARLIELHRVLKPTGSLYLHCDPTASHYLKVVMDTIFGKQNFRNEIVWKRTTIHRDAKRFGRVHDILLLYSKSQEYKWITPFGPHNEEYIGSHYTQVDESGRRYRLDNPTAKGPGPARVFFGRLMEPPLGAHWRWAQEEIDRLTAEGRIVPTRTGRPAYKRYLDEMPGTPVPDVWTDVFPINSMAKERLGYETQKPLALLERIIQASSNPDDIVLDPFCGCGTAVVAAQELGRRWIGIDVTHLAIAVMRKRLLESFPGLQFEVVGEPADLESARALAAQGPGDAGRWQFQWWALSLIGAQPLGDPSQKGKKGADRGIDGVITFAEVAGRHQRAIVSVKSGHVTSSQVRDLKGVLEREKAALGLFITLEPPTEPMRIEAATAGFYSPPGVQRQYPKVQILTVEELLAGKRPDIPGRMSPYAQAQRIAAKEGAQAPLSF